MDVNKLKNLKASSAEERLEKELRGEEIKEDTAKTISFGSKDLVDGNCFSVKNVSNLGQKVTKREHGEDLVVTEKNEVMQVGYLHPYYADHVT